MDVSATEDTVDYQFVRLYVCAFAAALDQIVTVLVSRA